MKTLDEQIEIAKGRLRRSWAANFPRLEAQRVVDEEDGFIGTPLYIREEFIDENLDDMLSDMAEETMDEYQRIGMRRSDF